ncbi:MAG: DUF2478 domain-containing protein, partial [Phycisphaerae bacterium]|nr:DUF2478 domain-containing protein [Phycisphaerae bacterium]
AREGLAFGREALGRPAELVIVDEFGPLELRGGGWRGAVETLLTASAGVVLLVVRDGLVEEVRRLYLDQQPVVTPAAGLDAASTVIDMLKCGGT